MRTATTPWGVASEGSWILWCSGASGDRRREERHTCLPVALGQAQLHSQVLLLSRDLKAAPSLMTAQVQLGAQGS